MITRVSLLDVQAHWAYSELLSTNPEWYDSVQGVVSLRNKRLAKVPFENLSSDEKYALAFQLSFARHSLFCYFTGIEIFEVVQIDRPRLGALLVRPNVWKESEDEFREFSFYITTQCADPEDARELLINQADYRTPIDPIIIGRSFQWAVLVDGYHRAALFWKFAPADATITAYLPAGTN